MAVDLDSGTGLFDRLGRMFYVLSLGEAYAAGSSAGDLPPEINDVLEEFDGESNNDIRAAVSGVAAALDGVQDNIGEFHTEIIAAAEQTLIEMVNADNPLPSLTASLALDELIRQMESASETVDANEPSVVATAGSGNDGNGVAVVSLLDGYGNTLEGVKDEDIECEVASTSTAFSETWTCRGEQNKALSNGSVFYPSGSGSTSNLTTVNPTSTNMLTNGAFSLFSANAPTGWTLDVGTAGSTVDDETTNTFRENTALKITGTGAELTQLSQDVTALCTSLTPYVVNVWTRVDAVAPAAGVLTIDLYDGSSVIADEAGTNNSFTIDLTSETSTYAQHSAVFRLPTPLPTTVTFRVRLSTALTNTKNAFVADLVMTPATQLYSGGPFVAFLTGSTAFSSDDTYSLAMTNDYRGAFQTRFMQVFNDPTRLLPSTTGGTETIADTLIA